MRTVVREAAAGCRWFIPVLCVLLHSSNASAGSCSERIQLLQARVNALLANQARAGIRSMERSFTALAPGAGSMPPVRSEVRPDGQVHGAKVLIYLQGAKRAQAAGNARACQSALRHARWEFRQPEPIATRTDIGATSVRSH